jgi:hypothetical protein
LLDFIQGRLMEVSSVGLPERPKHS